MANIKNIVKVMNFHSLIRVDRAKREANKFLGVEDELCKLLYQITNNTNLKLDKKILIENSSGIVLNIYIGNDLGFCGDFNYQLQKAIRQDLGSYKVVIGRKLFLSDSSDNVLLKIKKDDFLNQYYKIESLISDYVFNHKVKEINVFYNRYYNVNEIQFEKKRLFPIEIGTYDDVSLMSDFVIETDVNELISHLVSLSICYQIKMLESNSFASENVMRQKITNESLDKIEKKEDEQKLLDMKEKKERNFKKQINNYKNILR